VDYVFDLTIPANTPADNPVEQEIDVGEGIIHLVEIETPPGCRGEVYAAVRQGLHQVWPSNPDGAYRSDSRVYSAREHYPIGRDAPSLTLMGWSPGTIYDHTVQFRISVLPVEIMEPWRVQQGILDHLLQLLGIRPRKGKG